jgi:hypothetical protein
MESTALTAEKECSPPMGSAFNNVPANNLHIKARHASHAFLVAQSALANMTTLV